MNFIADFHIHSHFSIATSKQLVPEHLDRWASLKGIKVIGTGDFTHPGWLAEMKEKLEPAEPGLFRLKDAVRIPDDLKRNLSPESEPRFILTAEISSIYKKTGKTRKVHNVVFAPSFETVEKIQHALDKIGNITSDGRPILGLDSRDLLEIVLEADETIFFLPAHIWTPWFSALGAKSGFDTIAECYDDLAEHIHAVETGLSSDPPMNWMCSFLDKYTLLSNSDAHSPEKLGREANVFDCEISYEALINAIKKGSSPEFLGTIEFFPQEGKYHYDGHRKCNVCLNPVETLRNSERCPKCGKKVTVGVMNRVVQLSDREHVEDLPGRPGFHSLIPLKEILSQIEGVGPSSKKIAQTYHSLLQKAGSEFDLLLRMPIEEVKSVSNDIVAEGVRRMREREVLIQEGYDGEFGVIRVFSEEEAKTFASQDSLFMDIVSDHKTKYKARRLIDFDLEEYQRLRAQQDSEPIPKVIEKKPTTPTTTDGLNPEQRKAVEHLDGPALVVAGPGTGKTHVLTSRIEHLIRNHDVSPEHILAVTFTNKAADEMRQRLARRLDENNVSKIQVSTFHALGYSFLREHAEQVGRSVPFQVIDREDRATILRHQLNIEKDDVRSISDTITDAKQSLDFESDILRQYEAVLRSQNLLDLDDLISMPARLFSENEGILSIYWTRYRWILIDEYQDVNRAQYRLVRLLMPAGNANLFVIGDPNQAIYGFRGADVRFIRQFKEDYPQAVEYNLKQSYRCSNHILKASDGIIREQSAEASFLEGLQEGVKIHISQHPTDKGEAEFVARTIERMMGGLRFFSIDSDITEGRDESPIESLSDVAVLCRIGRQMHAVEKAFHDHSIPYQSVGETPFFKQEPVKSIIDVFRAASFPGNEYNRKHLQHLPDPGIFSSLSPTGSVSDTLQSIVDSQFKKEAEEKGDLLKRLLDLADDYGDDTEGFLKFVALGTSADTHQAGIETVSLMTMHASKGLEFDCVFIVGCEDGLLPYGLFDTMKCDIEEEKRLLYVGMTRAKRFLYLSHANKRFLYGKEYRLQRSPFLSKIQEELIEQSKSEYKKKPKREDKQLNLL